MDFFKNNRLYKLICFSCFIICFCVFGTAIAFAYTDTDISNQYVNETYVTETTVDVLTSSNVETTVPVTTELPTEVHTVDVVEQNESSIIETSCVQKYYYDADFNNSILESDIPVFSPWDVVGYVTCESADLHKVPITYDWAQDICDSRDIVMAPYTKTMFGQGIGQFICGHNYGVLKNLKNAQIGDFILIETVYGANYLYQIDYSDKVLLIQPDGDFSGFTDLNTGEYVIRDFEYSDTLCVFTCFDMNVDNYRWMVKAELVDGTDVIK